MNCRHIFVSSVSSFSSQYLLCFSNHQGAMFFFSLLLSLLSFVLQWYDEEGNLFSEYGQSNWLRRILFRSFPFQELFHWLFSLTILYSPFSSRTFQSSPNTSAQIILVFRSLKHILQCSIYNT